MVLFCVSKVASSQTPGKNFVIDGIITGAKEGEWVNLLDIERALVLDSALIDHGKFRLTGSVSHPTGCRIGCNTEYAIIQVENTRMHFTSPLKDMQIYSECTGGNEQVLQSQLNALQQPYILIYLKAYDSLINNRYSNDTLKKKAIDRFNFASNKALDIYIDFGRNHPNSYLGMDILFRNRKTISKDSLQYAYSRISEKLKKTTQGLALNNFLTGKFAKIGEPVPDFTVRTMEGKPFRLSSLKGKYVYLIFGERGCFACRIENKAIRRNYSSLAKNATLVYFSLDADMGNWKALTTQDSLIWLNVSDLKGGYSNVKISYGVQSLPSSFLIDKNGILVQDFMVYDDDEKSGNLARVIQLTNK
jgi:peroxiredoxin